MKSRFHYFPFLLSVILMTAAGCKKAVNDELQQLNGDALSFAGTTAATLQDLIAYKNSQHQLMAGYYRTWRDKATSTGNATTMRDLPDSLDIALVFPDYTPPGNPFWDSLRLTYVPYLHARGTRVVQTSSVGSFNSSGLTNDSAGYAQWAKNIYDSVVVKYNLDGFDMDIENNASGAELAKQVGLMKALSKHLGPKSGSGKLLIFDTNQNGTIPLFAQIYTLIDYVFLQAYGRSTSNLTSTFNSYATYITPDKFLPGFSFYEENGANWGDVTYPDPTLSGRCYQYARWQPTQGTKAGLFCYALDRDIPRKTDSIITPDYAVTKNLIRVMNGGTTGSGNVVLYQHCDYGGWAATLAAGNYTQSQLATLGAINNDASSIRVPAGYTVTLYANDNFSGTTKVLTADNSCFVNISFNDQLSSVKVVKN